jgi:NCAIR mutase (PurE)-related protein
LSQAPFEDLGFARVDHHRGVRQGFPEVIFGPGKTPQQIAAVATRLVRAGQTLLVTRTDASAFTAVAAEIPDAAFNPVARTITRPASDTPRGKGTILVAAAGTADLPVAEEAAICAEVMGNDVDRLYDVVAGMEGALPSVVGGLVPVPVIAVPTSVGYGANFGGIAALLGMLNSCASGVSVVNIDNGFGAAAVANAINHLT